MWNSKERGWSRRSQPRGVTAPGGTFPGLSRSFTLRLVTDVAVWCVSIATGALTAGASFNHGLVVGGLAALCHVLFGLLGGLYEGRWRLASFDEAVAVTGVVLCTSVSLALATVVSAAVGFTLAISMLAPFAALSAMLGLRGLRRFQLERESSTTLSSTDREPVVVFGAGDGGAQIVRAMLNHEASAYVPVALLDDSPAKQNLRLHGVPVVGTRSDLVAVAKKMGASLVIIAIPSAGAQTVEAIRDIAAHAGLTVRLVPPVLELVDGIVSLRDIREISEADLLGRRMIDTDVEAIAEYLRGASVLVTGAGGSIGSELCRQISTFEPAELILLDRDESGLHSTQLMIEGNGLLDSENLVVADIRDGERVKEIFATWNPDVVFHAAALKHLPLLERYPEEAWKTNVIGTNNVLRAAATHGVQHFVNISTDKAAEPTSVLGYTKRAAEQLTSWYAHRTRGDWVSVRFGNVLGSRGSMLTAFRSQVANGGPITVTHPDVTRYFMTPHEACQLVVQAGAVGARGEALVLDMGEPVRILDVAQRLAASATIPIDIVFTGLREGEKLHEDLISTDELDIRRAHPLISHVTVPALRPTHLGLFDTSGRQASIDSLRAIIGCSEENEDPILLP